MSRRRRGQQRVREPKEQYFPLRGGLDLVTSPYQINPGKMVDCFRYEIAPSGGSKPIDGYERVDGNGLPSEAVFQYLEYDDPLAEIAVGSVAVGSSSGATGISLITDLVDFGDGVDVDLTGKGVFLLTSGQFIDGEDITVLSTVVATVDTASTPNTELTDTHEEYFHWLAVEMQRSLVEKVPGSGPLRGVWRYDGTLYAFRDNAAGTECVMYEEDSVAGWVIVTTPTLLPGGAYLFENTNFGGSTSTIMMYGCDGKNKAFQFDGTTFTQITTGMADDTPILIYEHVKHLFLGFTGGSLQHSPPTDPTGTWSVVIDAGELGMGEELSSILSLPGGVLGIWCKDSIHILSGTGVGTWALTTHSKESGGIKGSVQNAGRTIFLNNTGLADLSATNAFGNFKNGTVSDDIQPLLDHRRKSPVCGSVAVSAKNQYRLFFEDGYFLTLTMNGRKVEFTQGHYDVTVRCISAPKRADDEVGNIYFGSDDGYVYKMDSGLSLDDEPMTAYIRLPYAHQGLPRRKKKYKEVVFELDASSGNNLSLAFLPDFSFRKEGIPHHALVDASERTEGTGIWSLSNWNEFSWSSDLSGGGGGTASGRVKGVSTEMGLMLYFNSEKTTTPHHVLSGVFIYYDILGRQP